MSSNDASYVKNGTLPVAAPDLPAALSALIEQIPAGCVTTYAALAEALGSEAATPWVGQWMLHHQHRRACSCHRVVRSDGRVGHYIGGEPSRKVALLRQEGIEVTGERIEPRRLEMVFRDFQTDRPLLQLREIQHALKQRVSLRGRRTMPGTVAGVDVSYRGGEGVAAYVLWDLREDRLAWSTTLRLPVRFPYISSFLSFRELPILLELIERVRAAGRMAELVVVDGSGVLHPRGAGIACHFGVLAPAAAIGVSKKLLCGKVDLAGMAPGEARPVLIGGRRRGVALRPTSGSRRPIFISPGHRIGVGMAERVIRRLLLGRRLPEPQYWADRLSRSAAVGRS